MFLRCGEMPDAFPLVKALGDCRRGQPFPQPRRDHRQIHERHRAVAMRRVRIERVVEPERRVQQVVFQQGLRGQLEPSAQIDTFRPCDEIHNQFFAGRRGTARSRSCRRCVPGNIFPEPAEARHAFQTAADFSAAAAWFPSTGGDDGFSCGDFYPPRPGKIPQLNFGNTPVFRTRAKRARLPTRQ